VDGKLVVGTRAGRIYRSEDRGETWEPFGSSPPGPPVEAMVADDARIFAGFQGRGVWRVSR